MLIAAVGTITGCDSQDDIEADPALQESVSALSGSALSVSGVKASADDGNVPANVLDGNLATRWSCSGVGCWIRADLGTARSLTGIAVAWYVGNTRMSNYVVSVSNDDVTYTQVLSGKSSGTTLHLEPYGFGPVTARYVRLTVNGNTSNTWASVTELKVWGGDVAAPSPTLEFPRPRPRSRRASMSSGRRTSTRASPGRASGTSSGARTRVSSGTGRSIRTTASSRCAARTTRSRSRATAPQRARATSSATTSVPLKDKTWQNVEFTMYSKRVSESSSNGIAPASRWRPAPVTATPARRTC